MPAGFGYAFEPRGDVDPVAEDVIALDQDVAEMDADAPFHSALAGKICVPFRGEPLQCQGAFDRPNHRGKLDQHAVASRLDNPPATLGNEWIGGDPMFEQRPRRACFVEPHQPTVANHIGG
jgi:hypothetical protein